jgi:hypothetical protein
LETIGLIQGIENIRQEEYHHDRIKQSDQDSWEGSTLPPMSNRENVHGFSAPHESVSAALAIGMVSNNDRPSE